MPRARVLRYSKKNKCVKKNILTHFLYSKLFIYKTKIIYFVHGTTYDNATGKCSGWKQVELNELGKEQAINLGKTTKNLKFDVIFTF